MREERIPYNPVPHARIVLFRFTRGTGYTKQDAEEARKTLGNKEADRVINEARNYRANKFRKKLPGSPFTGKK